MASQINFGIKSKFLIMAFRRHTPCFLLHFDLISWHLPSHQGHSSQTGLAIPSRIALSLAFFHRPQQVLKRCEWGGVNNFKNLDMGSCKSK